MAKKARDRRILVKLLSTAFTGVFYTARRIRTSEKLSLMKFDPKVNKHVLFVEGGRIK